MQEKGFRQRKRTDGGQDVDSTLLSPVASREECLERKYGHPNLNPTRNRNRKGSEIGRIMITSTITITIGGHHASLTHLHRLHPRRKSSEWLERIA